MENDKQTIFVFFFTFTISLASINTSFLSISETLTMINLKDEIYPHMINLYSLNLTYIYIAKNYDIILLNQLTSNKHIRKNKIVVGLLLKMKITYELESHSILHYSF